eukprot:scaffold83663_cov19-Prasinocladus_malaysianus.AAC.1
MSLRANRDVRHNITKKEMIDHNIVHEFQLQLGVPVADIYILKATVSYTKVTSGSNAGLIYLDTAEYETAVSYTDLSEGQAAYTIIDEEPSAWAAEVGIPCRHLPECLRFDCPRLACAILTSEEATWLLVLLKSYGRANGSYAY